MNTQTNVIKTKVINSTFPSLILVAMICLRCCMILISRSHSSSSLFSCRDAFTYTGQKQESTVQVFCNSYAQTKCFAAHLQPHLMEYLLKCITDSAIMLMQNPCDSKTTLEDNCAFLCCAGQSSNQLSLFTVCLCTPNTCMITAIVINMWHPVMTHLYYTDSQMYQNNKIRLLA